MKKLNTLAAFTVLALAGTAANAAQIQVSFTNNSGVYFTPLWAGFHDGGFDSFDVGSSASASIEALAEDGNQSVLASEFAEYSTANVGGRVGAGPLDKGDTFTGVFEVAVDGSNDFFSFASMVLPSSDFFIGNSSPLAFNISSLLDGSTSSISFDVASVYDAGTEVNDFETSAGNPLFGIAPGQSVAGEGTNENGVITRVGGLAYASFLNSAGLDDVVSFNFDDFASFATIELTVVPDNVSAVPVPAAAFLFAPALLGFMGLRRNAAKKA
jgi:hypothetical protein